MDSDRVTGLLARRHIDMADIVRVVEVGSTAHGIAVDGSGDDADYIVVRMERFEELVVGSHDRQSMMIRTKPEGVRSEAGDIDLSVYTLRKFAGLACNGNPSILGAIFSKSVHRQEPMVDFSRLGELVASRRAGSAFLGYMTQQIERWLGLRTKKVSRPELVEQFGYDTKYAGHVIRLGIQGVEYLTKGSFLMPMAPSDRDRIVKIRTGHLDEYDALRWARELESQLRDAIEHSRLPGAPDEAAVHAWVVGHYQRTLAPVTHE